jgi:hypothetical protein
MQKENRMHAKAADAYPHKWNQDKSDVLWKPVMQPLRNTLCYVQA